MSTRTTSIKDFLCDLPEGLHKQFLNIITGYDKENEDLEKEVDTLKDTLADSRSSFGQVNDLYNYTYEALKQSMVLNTTLDETNKKLDETNKKLADITSQLADDIRKLHASTDQSFHTHLPLRRERADSVITTGEHFINTKL